MQKMEKVKGTVMQKMGKWKQTQALKRPLKNVLERHAKIYVDILEKLIKMVGVCWCTLYIDSQAACNFQELFADSIVKY